MAASPAPGVLARMSELVRAMPAERGGVLWKLTVEGRQLDANVVRLAPGAQVAAHAEPALDVLVYVLGGGGRLDVDGERHPLEGGSVVWLPRGARRALEAGAHGLDYLTVHRRRPGMTIGHANEPAHLMDRVCPECGRLAPDTTDVRFCGHCGSRLPER